MRWFGHVKGSENEFIGRMVLEMELVGKKVCQRGALWMQ